MNILNIAVDQHLLKMRRRATTVTSEFDFFFSETQNLWILYFELDVKGVTRLAAEICARFFARAEFKIGSGHWADFQATHFGVATLGRIGNQSRVTAESKR